jgi:hypothetical protein
MQYLEKDIPLPVKFWHNTSQPVFNLLCEDAILFYTVRPHLVELLSPTT